MPPERAVLVGVSVKGQHTPWSLDSSLEELARLAETAGAQVVGTVSQHVEHFTPYYLGKGKLQEIIDLKDRVHYGTAIFDDELTPAQQRNLERALDVKVIDRTALILDIFARHARTREGRLQVELAQHQYLLPRLAGQWTHLERLGGGIGTRGPGESQLETDRRMIRQRIARLQKDIEVVRQRRALHRASRRRRGSVLVSLVGYTNAGKSTLMNALTHADVLVQDQPFATLDPVTRKLKASGGGDILLSDTVGFIQKLPTALVAAFRATLEEMEDADLLLHVVDVSDINAPNQKQTVNETLEGLGLQDKPQITVLNKVDKVKAPVLSLSSGDVSDDLVEGWQPPAHPSAGLMAAADEDTVIVSALTGQGLDALLQRLQARVAALAPTPA